MVHDDTNAVNHVVQGSAAVIAGSVGYWTTEDMIKYLTILFILCQLVVIAPKVYRSIAGLFRHRKVGDE